jgi:hypothetical protein
MTVNGASSVRCPTTLGLFPALRYSQGHPVQPEGNYPKGATALRRRPDGMLWLYWGASSLPAQDARAPVSESS